MHGPTFSIVIPAHDEQAVIGRCLAFMDDLEPGEAEIVVVANGCQDDTAQLAACVPGVRVIELEKAGKAAALNAGDEVVAAFPRVYLDADITVSAQALRRVRDSLDRAEARICAPRVRLRTGGRPWSVRSFYEVYRRLPYVRDGLTGLGFYAVSAAGRRRFDTFPGVTADDLFVQRLFAPQERMILADEYFDVETPYTLANLVAVRTRTAQGNAELATSDLIGEHRSSGRETARALIALVRADLRLVVPAVIYAGVVAAARRRARTAGPQWQRDGSTR